MKGPHVSTSPVKIRDNGGRRSGIDLRQFSYTGHIPERRSGEDRRNGTDRRNIRERRAGEDRRKTPQKLVEKKESKIIDLRSHKERRGSINRRAAFG